MSQSTAPKPGAPSGQAVPKEAIAQKEPRVTTLVKTKEEVASGHHIIKDNDRRVPYFSQNPDRPPPSRSDLTESEWRWGSQKMQQKTIGGVGCGLTSAAMVLGYYGYDVTPLKLNEFALSKTGDDKVYGTNSDLIVGWSQLFSYGGAKLTHKQGREFSREELKTEEGRAPLWDLARKRAKANKPSIARVDYVDPEPPTDDPSKYDKWGDHFVVIVGLHKNGKYLIINDPGRNQSNTNGNGADFPDSNQNWLAENPKEGCQKKHVNGYTLIRIDEIDRKERTEAPPPSDTPLTIDTWPKWAKEQIDWHIKNFIPRLLEAARTAIVGEIEALFDRVARNGAVDYTFNAKRIDLLVEQEANSIIDGIHRDLGDKILAVIDKVEQRTGLRVAVSLYDFAKKAMPSIVNVAKGVVQKVGAAITSGANFLDLSKLPIPGADLAAALEKGIAALGELGAPTVKFGLKRLEGGKYGLTLGAGLLSQLGDKADWLEFENEGELTFVFPSVSDVADAIVAKAFKAIGLIDASGQYAPILDGLITEEDKERLKKTIDGRVRLVVKANATKFSAKKVLDALNASVAQGHVVGELTIDFYGSTLGNRAELLLDVHGTAQIGSAQAVAEVSMHADGKLTITDTSFKPIWDGPAVAFESLISQFVETLDGKVRISFKAAAATNTANAPAFGLFRLEGSAQSELIFELKNRKASLDFSNAGAVEIDYEGHNIALALKAGTGARFEVPAPHSFLQFWKDPKTRWTELVDHLLLSLPRANLEFNAKTSTSIGLLRLSPDATMTAIWDGSQMSLQLGAKCLSEVTYDGHDLTLAIGGQAGARFPLAGAPTFSMFWKKPKESFASLIDRLLDSLSTQALVEVTAKDVCSTRLLQMERGGTFTLDFAPPEIALRFQGRAMRRPISANGEIIELSLGGGADVVLDMRDIDIRAFWKNRQESFNLLLDDLPSRIAGSVRVVIAGSAGIPIGTKAKLFVDGGLVLVFERDRLRLEFQGATKIVVPECSIEAALGIDLDLQPGALWEVSLQGDSFRSFWRNPETELPQLLDRFLDEFAGHARMKVAIQATEQGQLPLPGVLAKLREMPLLKLEALMGGGQFIVDYRSLPSGRSVTLQYDVGSAVAVELAGKAQLTAHSAGVTRLSGRSLKALLRSPGGELAAIGAAAVAHLASDTNIVLTYRGVLLRANAEQIQQAIVAFDAGEYLQGLVSIEQAAFVTLPGGEEQPLRTLGAGIVVAYYLGWLD